MVPRTSTDIEQSVISSYQEGRVPVWEIGESHNITRESVFNILRRNGVARRRRTGPKRSEFTTTDRARLLFLRRTGWSKERLADEFECGRERVSRVLSEEGLAESVRRYDAKDRIITRHGYAYVLVSPDDPLAVMRGRNEYVFEHRLVMARSLGRPLNPDDTVHHINGVRDDNRIENLQLRQGRHGKGVVHKCIDCGSTNIETAPLAS